MSATIVASLPCTNASRLLQAMTVGSRLSRPARKSRTKAIPATKQPDGQINSDYQKSCQSLESKINPLPRRANQIYNSRHPVPQEGRRPSSQTRDRERWTRRLRKTSAAVAYGEVDWVRRPGAGVKSEAGESLQRRWWQSSRSPGRNRISRKAIAQGRPGVLR